MRVTNMMMIKTMNHQLSNNLSTLSELNTQMSTGKAFQHLSEDPVNASKSIKYTSYISQLEQYIDNANDAAAHLDITESSINNIQEVLEDIRELTVQGANETLTDEDQEVIETEVAMLMEQMIEIGNTEIAGVAIFGGYEIYGSPVDINEFGLMTYNGQCLAPTGPYNSEMTDEEILAYYHAQPPLDDQSNENMIFKVGANSEVDVNVEGQEVFGVNEKNAFSVVQKIMMALRGEASCKVVQDGIVEEIDLDLSELIGELDISLENLRSVKAEVGAKRSYVDLCLNRLDDDVFTFTSLLSLNEDVDIAEVSMKLANAESVYNAALSAGAKIITPSLMDFIR